MADPETLSVDMQIYFASRFNPYQHVELKEGVCKRLLSLVCYDKLDLDLPPRELSHAIFSLATANGLLESFPVSEIQLSAMFCEYCHQFVVFYSKPENSKKLEKLIREMLEQLPAHYNTLPLLKKGELGDTSGPLGAYLAIQKLQSNSENS